MDGEYAGYSRATFRSTSIKAEKIKLTGWITLEQLKKVIVLTKPKGKCVEVNIDVVPIKKGAKNG